MSEFCGRFEHVFGPEVERVSASGPLEGRWLTAECQNCTTFSLRPLDGGDAIGPLLAALERATGERAQLVGEST